MVNAVKLYENEIQVDFHLIFIVDTKMKQNPKTGLVVVRWEVRCGFTALVQHHGSGISPVSKDDSADFQNYLPFI